MTEPLILGIETSCDETAAAVVSGPRHVLSNIVATQHDLHEQYHGVVPEIASRAHVERILPVVRDAVDAAGTTYDQLDAVAVGHRPGLIGSLLVGVSTAKALAWSLRIPLIGVDHIVAHLHAGELGCEPASYPAIGLVVSGGHTSLFEIRSLLDLTLIGRTIDDAIGEAYDKAATILHLGYPGGPLLDELATQGNDRAHDLPIARLDGDRLDFSFSGLKTALLYRVCGMPRGRGRSAFERDASALNLQEKADFAASFQRAAVGAIIRNVTRALDRLPATRTLFIGGGVSANSRLRRELTELARRRDISLRLPAAEYCLDNAAMIAGLGALRLAAGQSDAWSLTASPRTAVD